MEKTAFQVRTDTCSKCRYSSEEAGGQLACRFNPPQMFVVPQSPGPGIAPQMGFLAAWPNVGPTNWCGKFEARLDG